MRLSAIAGLAVFLLVLGCTNNPYPESDGDRKVLYSSFNEAPKTLDPAVAYTTAEHVVTGTVFDTLLEYHFLKRPYELIPSLAEAIPQAEPQLNGQTIYRFKLRPGVLFHADPCFALNLQGKDTREVLASDVGFQLARLADPAVNSPVASTFGDVLGFTEFSKRLVERRKADAAFAALPAHEQYKQAGGIEGVVVRGTHELDIVLAGPNPQLLYWFAMPFTTPMPWEAVAYYDGKDGRPNFSDQAVGTGAFRLALYERQHRFVLQRNPNWHGILQPQAKAPGATFPSEFDPKDVTDGIIDPAYAGRPLPFLSSINFTRERENIPRFNKFLQGYYDDGGIIKESFDAIVQDDRLSPEMAVRGMRLDKEVEPTVFHLGFNMDDATVGHAGGDRARKLRQAMSLAIDSEQYMRLFLNGRGLAAQSPLPPEIFGYDANYKNPFRQPDLVRARALLAEAGYKNGIDSKTQQPLRLTFDTGNTTAAAFLQYEFFVSGWRELGLDVQILATTYNQFQDRVRRGAYQIYQWGWVADFPDPENFFFLLECSNAQSKSKGPNTSNFCNPRYDELYREMKNLPNNARRGEIIREMVRILETERPWIELYHNEDYRLSHAWLVNAKPMGMSIPTFKYQDVNPKLREKLRAEWNKPVRWPLYLVLLVIVGATVPAIRTYYRERV